MSHNWFEHLAQNDGLTFVRFDRGGVYPYHEYVGSSVQHCETVYFDQLSKAPNGRDTLVWITTDKNQRFFIPLALAKHMLVPQKKIQTY